LLRGSTRPAVRALLCFMASITSAVSQVIISHDEEEEEAPPPHMKNHKVGDHDNAFHHVYKGERTFAADFDDDSPWALDDCDTSLCPTLVFGILIGLLILCVCMCFFTKRIKKTNDPWSGQGAHGLNSLTPTNHLRSSSGNSPTRSPNRRSPNQSPNRHSPGHRRARSEGNSPVVRL
jgi:hypothetical protein